MESAYNTTIFFDGTTVGNLRSHTTNCRSRNASIELLYECMVPSPSEWFLISAYIVVFVVGVIGNTLVCFTVWKNKEMRKVTNVFMVNLSVADLAVLVMLLPSTLLMDITGTWYFGQVMCKLTIALGTMCISVSVMTLTAISVERWYAICRPLRFRSTIRRARIIIGIIWIISFGVSLPECIASTVVQLRPNTVIHSVCYPALWDVHDITRLQICLMAGFYFAPLLIMGFVYTNIAIVLWRRSTLDAFDLQSVNQRHPRVRLMSRDNGDILEERKRVAKMLGAVVAVFAVCFLPNHTLNILRYTGKLQEIPNLPIFALVAHWTIFFNSCINPIIYNFMSDTFRKEFRVAMHLCLHCGRIGSVPHHVKFAGKTSLVVRYSKSSMSHCAIQKSKSTCVEN